MDSIKNTLKEVYRNDKQESTAAPYWLIIDPKQITGIDSYAIASMAKGPFFCREDAEDYLYAKRHNFSDNAIVFCNSGYHSRKYVDFCNEIRKEIREEVK